MVAQARVPGFHLGQEFVANPVAGESKVAIGGVFTPWLVKAAQVLLDLRARGAEQGADHRAFGKPDSWVNSAQTLSPGSAQKTAKNGFGLVVAGMSSGHGVDCARGEEFAEPGVAEPACCLFDGFGGFGGRRIRSGRGGGVGPGLVEGYIEPGGQLPAEIPVGVRLSSAQAVVQVGGMEHQSQFPAPLGKDAQKGHGVRSPGEAHGETHAGLE